jgi:signal transduction histidine kinase
VGAIYLYDKVAYSLVIAASYALPAGAVKQNVALGESVLGQAALQRKTIVLNNLPSEYFPIASATGSAPTGCVIATSLSRADMLIGALELGSFEHFGAIECELLESVREVLGIRFAMNLSHKQTRELLKETQVQTEELQVQQEELQQTNEELEERAEMLELQREQLRTKNAEIEEVSEEIQRKAEQLEKISAFKSEFLANMSHELRTPLNSLLILSALLKDNKEKNLTAKQVEFATTINGAGQDLLNLINDILDLSKVEAGQVDFHYDDVPATSLCDTMKDLFQQPAEQKGLHFTTDIEQDVPPRLHIDFQRTQQILKNLIGNAIKFTREGSVGLRVFVPAPETSPLDVPAFACAVIDTGIGV